MLDTAKILNDSGWIAESGSPLAHRGITDYKRAIAFERALTPHELEIVKAWLAKNNCPGWTAIVYVQIDNIYTFSTTMDSTD